MKNIRPSIREKVHGPHLMSESLTVSGLVRNPGTIPYDTLAAMKQVSVEGYNLHWGSGRIKDAPRVLTGVLLRDVLDEADIILDSHEDPGTMYVVATGNDGYRALFSWHELFNGPGGEGVLVILARDGIALGPEDGRLMLASVRDERTGPRQVRYLSSVDVRSL